IHLERVDGEIRVRSGGLHLPLAAGAIDPATDDEALNVINGDPQRIHAVLEEQHYRLAYWRAANDEINYRRFFDVNGLVGLRVEDPELFEASHRLLARLVSEERITGIRIDHPDGLFDPAAYFERL